MTYGIEALGMPMPLGNERLIIEADKIQINDVNFRHGWYDIKNIPHNINLSEIMLFIRSDIVEFKGDMNGRKLDRNLYFYPFVFRRENGKIQLKIQPQTTAGVLNLLATGKITKVKIDLKVCYRLNRIEKSDIPKYGVAVYSENGDCIYTNNTKLINNIRIVTSGVKDYYGVGKPQYPLLEKMNFSEIKIDEDEYVLYSPKGFFDEADKERNIHFYRSGIIIPTVHNNKISLNTLALNHSSGGSKRFSVPKFNNADVYYQYTINDNKFVIIK